VGIGLTWLASGALAQPVAASANLFEQAFAKRRAQSVQQIALPTTLDGRDVGLVNAQIRNDGVWLAREALLTALDNVVQPSSKAALASAEPAGQWISTEALKTLGLEAVYSAQSITLELRVPMRLRLTRVLSMDERNAPVQGKAAESILMPERWSLIANTRWVLTDTQTDLGNLTTVRTYLEAAQRMGEWVVEAAGSVPIGPTGAVGTRDMTRLVRDWPAQAIRLSVGDLNTAARPGVPSVAAGGIQLSRRFNLNPALNSQSQPTERLVLPQGAAVDVRANGFVSRTLQLAPGVYELKDIPVFTGANEVELNIVEPGGRSSVRRFDYFFDASVLAPGLTEFDLAFGRPSRVAATGLRYSPQQSVTALSWRHGLTAQTTVGAAAQWRSSGSGDMVRVLQADGLWATRWGTGQAYVTQNAHPGFSGQAASLQWSAQSTVRRELTAGRWSWAAVVQSSWRAPGHASLLSDTASAGSRDFGARLSALTPIGLTASLSASQRRGDLPADQGRTLSVSLRKAIAPQWSMEAVLSGQHDPIGRRQQVNISLRYSGKTQPNGITPRAAMGYQSSDSRWQLDAEATGVTTVAGADAPWRMLASSARSAQAHETSLRAALNTSRAELSAFVNDSRRTGVASGFSRLSELAVASSLIVTPSGWALTRPVSDSAARVAPRPGYEQLSIYIDPSLDRSAAASDRFGAPVLNDLNAYTPREIQLDVADLPPGRSLGVDRPLLKPAYRSVITVPLGSDANVQFSGSVVTAKGQPAGLVALRLTPVGKGEPVELFTSRRGRFTSPPLPPGRYWLNIPGDPKPLKQLKIEPQQVGIVDVGSIELGTSEP
jgi:outer membrane usher protein